MSQKKPAKRKVVVSTEKKVLKPTTSRSKSKANVKTKELIFNQTNYRYMVLGIVLIIIGLFLMAGGHMPDNNTWDPDIIYSFRRTVLAPIVIMIGLLVEIYAIFKK
jgi:sulfite exporter TauE/SafE